MNHTRIDIASIRRAQIIEASIAIIAEQGLQNLSLSEIESKTGMSRGQLTYYFRAKEDILLAVFDRLLELMCQRIGTPGGQPSEQAGTWQWVQHLLQTLVGQPPVSPEFHCLQYTFLSQIGHREDFRQRLASLYGQWRDNMARDLQAELIPRRGNTPVSPRALATVVQALLHGLAMQKAADPQAFETEEVLHLCLDMLGSYLADSKSAARKPRKPAAEPAPATTSAPKGEPHDRDDQ